MAKEISVEQLELYSIKNLKEALKTLGKCVAEAKKAGNTKDFEKYNAAYIAYDKAQTKASTLYAKMKENDKTKGLLKGEETLYSIVSLQNILSKVGLTINDVMNDNVSLDAASLDSDPQAPALIKKIKGDMTDGKGISVGLQKALALGSIGVFTAATMDHFFGISIFDKIAAVDWPIMGQYLKMGVESLIHFSPVGSIMVAALIGVKAIPTIAKGINFVVNKVKNYFKAESVYRQLKELATPVYEIADSSYTPTEEEKPKKKPEKKTENPYPKKVAELKAEITDIEKKYKDLADTTPSLVSETDFDDYHSKMQTLKDRLEQFEEDVDTLMADYDADPDHKIDNFETFYVNDLVSRHGAATNNVDRELSRTKASTEKERFDAKIAEACKKLKDAVKNLTDAKTVITTKGSASADELEGFDGLTTQVALALGELTSDYPAPISPSDPRYNKQAEDLISLANSEMETAKQLSKKCTIENSVSALTAATSALATQTIPIDGTATEKQIEDYNNLLDAAKLAKADLVSKYTPGKATGDPEYNKGAEDALSAVDSEIGKADGMLAKIEPAKEKAALSEKFVTLKTKFEELGEKIKTISSKIDSIRIENEKTEKIEELEALVKEFEKIRSELLKEYKEFRKVNSDSIWNIDGLQTFYSITIEEKDSKTGKTRLETAKDCIDKIKSKETEATIKASIMVLSGKVATIGAKANLPGSDKGALSGELQLLFKDVEKLLTSIASYSDLPEIHGQLSQSYNDLVKLCKEVSDSLKAPEKPKGPDDKDPSEIERKLADTNKRLDELFELIKNKPGTFDVNTLMPLVMIKLIGGGIGGSGGSGGGAPSDLDERLRAFADELLKQMKNMLDEKGGERPKGPDGDEPATPLAELVDKLGKLDRIALNSKDTGKSLYGLLDGLDKKFSDGEISREDYDQLKSFLELLKKKRENETKGLDIHGKPLAGGEIRAHKAKTFFERTRDELGDTADEKKSKEILERVIAIQTEREKGV